MVLFVSVCIPATHRSRNDDLGFPRLLRIVASYVDCIDCFAVDGRDEQEHLWIRGSIMRYWWLLLGLVMVCGVASAIPTTGAATAVGNNNATLWGSGVTGGVGWFQFGEASGFAYAHTKNLTADDSGNIVFTMKGSPLIGLTTFYYRACDPTGCGDELSFITTEVTPLPMTHYGSYAENMTENGLDPGNFIWNSMQPYIAVTGQTIFFGLILSMIFVGVWLRTRGTIVATSLGVICIGLFISAVAGLQLGLAPEFVAAAQAVLYVSLAGIVVSFTFK